MKTVMWMTLAVGFFAVSAFTGIAQEQAKPALVVLNLTNRAGPDYDYLRKRGADKLETILAKTNLFDVLERERMKEILDEQQIGPEAEAGDIARSIAEKAGADYVVIGNIRNMGKESRRYEGAYGSPSVNVRLSVDASIKIVDAKSGKTWFGDEETAEQVVRETPGIIIEQDDISDNLLEKAFEKMVIRLEEKYPSLGKPSTISLKQVSVSVSSKPPGADILVDGMVVGTTPAEIKVSEAVHLVELRLIGFFPWKSRMAVSDGISINPTLSQLPPPAEPLPAGSPFGLKKRTVTDEYVPQAGGQEGQASD